MKEQKDIYEFISEFEKRITDVTGENSLCKTLELMEENTIRTKLEITRPERFSEFTIWFVTDLRFETTHMSIVYGVTGEEIWLGEFDYTIDQFLELIGRIISYRIEKEIRRYRRLVESDEKLLTSITSLLRN